MCAFLVRPNERTQNLAQAELRRHGVTARHLFDIVRESLRAQRYPARPDRQQAGSDLTLRILSLIKKKRESGLGILFLRFTGPSSWRLSWPGACCAAR